MNNQLKYSICCLFRDYSKYINLKVFFEKIGFVGDVENLSIDNVYNKFDSYQALRYFIEKSSGDYIIILHDDVELSSNKRDELDIQINSCLRKDPQAAIFGIAGKHKKILAGKGHFVSYRGDEFWGFQDQGIVQTLDECFLIIRKDSGDGTREVGPHES